MCHTHLLLAEAIRKRFKTFVEQSLPVKDHYSEKGVAHVISATASPDEVFESVVKVLDSLTSPQQAASA